MNSWDIQEWFREHVTLGDEVFSVSDEQAEAILDDHKNTIVTARAGSGKTRLIVAKTIYLIAHEGYDPSDIIAFAFNTNASKELNDRLAKVKVDGVLLLPDGLEKRNRVATTFHSFAARARSFGGEILSDRECDDKEKQAFIPNRSYFIQRIIKDKLNRKKVLEFIRDAEDKQSLEGVSVEESGASSTREECYYETLNGEIVRSFGEKIIADYLFEHDIDYRYEKFDLYPSQLAKFAKDEASADKLRMRDAVRPDFYLEDYNLIWEHWGVSGLETPEEIQIINKSKIFDGGYERYLNGRRWKEWFYDRSWLNDSAKYYSGGENYYLSQLLKYKGLITTYKDPFSSRVDFENKIEKRLAEFGIHKPRLSEEEIIEKLFNNKNHEVVTRLTEQITSFIDKAQHNFMSNYDKLHALCKSEKDPHVHLFYELALEALNYYTNELTSDISDEKQRPLLDECFEKKYTTDFNILLDTAARLINERRENPRLVVDGYKYIFIDEYQDFSELFFKLIKALRERSDEAKMMVVGDDWQAINSYAGSDLKFFENFEEYFPDDNSRIELLTNFRSVDKIVELSNLFMERAGITGSGSKTHNLADGFDDPLQICQVSGIKMKKDKNSNRSYKAQQYDRALTEIIKNNEGKTICFLSRKKVLTAYGNLNNCKNEIKKRFEEEDRACMTKTVDMINDNITVSTVNSAKGCEADIVVIIETDNGSFPVIHPDTELYKVFGESTEKMIDEQKRLFYVALTRPKEKLYILHEKDFNDSEVEQENFLTMLDRDELGQYDPQPRTIAERIKDGEINCFIANDVEVVQNKYRPNNHDFIVTAYNGDVVRQFNVDRSKDKESCEVIDSLVEFFSDKENKGKHIWAEVQDGKWIHFRKRRPSDYIPDAL